MKIHLTLVVILLLFDCLSAQSQSLFINSIEFKGRSEQQHFKGVNFDINFEDGVFIISHHEERSKKFVIKRNDDSVQDLVFSPDNSVIAVAMRATDSKSRGRTIVTIDASGKKRVFEYEAYKMTERLGWIVELGAVSNDGACILAKCALMLPENEVGVSYVRHEWTILKISDDSINVIDSVDAIDKWHDYVRMGCSPTKELNR